MKHTLFVLLAWLMCANLSAQMYLWKDGKYTVSELDSITFTAPDAPAEAYSVPVSSKVDAIQPMTGLVMWPSHDKINTYKSSISLEFSYCLPCKVVKGKQNGKIQYDWSYMEKKLDDISSRGHQAIIRFRYEYPNSTDVNGTKGQRLFRSISRTYLIIRRPTARIRGATDPPIMPIGAMPNCNGLPNNSILILPRATTTTPALPFSRWGSDTGRSITSTALPSN